MHENIRVREMVSLKVKVRLVFFIYFFQDRFSRYRKDFVGSFNFWTELGRNLKETLQRDSIWWKENGFFSLSLFRKQSSEMRYRGFRML